MKPGHRNSQAPLLAAGTRVEKIASEPRDGHRDGAKATVVKTMGPIPDGKYGYFVEWDDMPGIPVFVAGWRVREIRK